MTAAARARILTAAAMAALAIFLAFRDKRPASSLPAPKAEPAANEPRGSTAPQDTIYRMFDAARAGDVGVYASQFDGAMAASIRAAVVEQGEAKFGGYLSRTHGSVKGLAVDAPQPVSERETKVRVEYVYADRNEGQLMYLERDDAAREWKIVRLDKVERVKTAVPYGTPAQ